MALKVFSLSCVVVLLICSSASGPTDRLEMRFLENFTLWKIVLLFLHLLLEIPAISLRILHLQSVALF